MSNATLPFCGVQPHSMGGLFPYVLYARQADASAPLVWGVLSPNGAEQPVGTYAQAAAVAAEAKAIDIQATLMRRHNVRPLAPADISALARQARDNGDAPAAVAVERLARTLHHVDW